MRPFRLLARLRLLERRVRHWKARQVAKVRHWVWDTFDVAGVPQVVYALEEERKITAGLRRDLHVVTEQLNNTTINARYAEARLTYYERHSAIIQGLKEKFDRELKKAQNGGPPNGGLIVPDRRIALVGD